MADPPGGRVNTSGGRWKPKKEKPVLDSGGSTSSQSHTSFKKGVAKVREAKKAEQQTSQEQQPPSGNPMKKTRKETEERIESLIKRLQRQFSSQRPSEQKWQLPPRPPDQAASSLGKELASAFLQTLDYPSSDNTEFEALRQKTLQCLANRGVHPSIPHAFFAELTSEASLESPNLKESSYEEWLPSFILQCEQIILDELPNSTHEDADTSSLNETLAAAVKAYALYSAKMRADDEDTDSQQKQQKNPQKQSLDLLTTTYRRMQSSAGRTILLREFSRSINELSAVRHQLSPLMAACVLTTWATPQNEKTLFLQELWRQCWDVIYATDDFDDFWDILFWMTEALNIFLLVLPSAARNAREHKPAWREMAQCWLMELGDMLAFVVHATTSEENNNGSQASERLLAEWLQVTLNKLVPIMSLQGAGSYRLSLEPLLEQINGLVVEMDDSLLQLDTMIVFKLSSMAMATPLKGEARCILSLFSYLLPSESAFARGLTSALGSIYLQDDTCHAAAKHLLKTAQGIDQQLLGLSDRTKTTSVVQLLEDGEDGYEVLEFIANVDAYALENLSAVKQVEALLLGVSMVEINNNEKLQESAKGFLEKLIRRYPHLGLSLLPALLEDINASAVEKTPKELLSKLEFLCDSVMVDPSCAQQAWNLLGGQMLQPHNPVPLRVTVIRLLPRLCKTNKRLYRRIIDTLGAHRDGKMSSDSGPDSLSPDSMSIQPVVMEIKLAVAASIADLAKEDLIRDPADCIGWIQEFLVADYSESPMNALLVHYAILALHHLVVAQELDFSLVLKVLKKKLCDMSTDTVKDLPAVVLESLALLLGDGECKSASSSEENGEEEEEDTPKVPEISPQVVGAVQLLIDLGFQYEDVQPSNDISIESIAKIRRNIYTALSSYSLDCLGLDEDGIKAALDEGNAPTIASRYIALRHLAIEGLRMPVKLREVVEDLDEVVRAFNLKMLTFEEEALSSNLWATKGTRHHAFPQRKGDANKAMNKDALVLPSPAKVQTLHKKKPSTVSSIACLLCFEGKSVSKFLSLAGDVSFQDTEPVINVCIIQAWLQASSRLLSHLHDGNKVKGLSQTVEEIKRWGDLGNNLADAVYLTLAALSVYVPHSNDRSESVLVDKIQGEVWTAFKGLLFLNSDIGKIAIAFTAISALRFGSQERADEIIVALQQSVSGYGGQVSFGACYGLAAIAQAIGYAGQSSKGDNVSLKSKIGNIAGFLVRELLACTEPSDDTSDILTTLVACLQSGVSTPGLVASLAESVSNQFSVLPAKQETARYLLISLGICLPSLSQVNGDLLLGTLFLLEKFQWGSGKGIALVPVLAEAKQSGVLTADEYNVIISEYARVFEQGLGGHDTARLRDLFYAVNATNVKPSPHVTRQFLTQSSHLFDDDQCTSPLVGAVVAVGTFPCLGFGSKTCTSSAQLRSDIPNAILGSVLDIIVGALDSHTDHSKSTFSRNAVAVLGLLCSMQKTPVDLNRILPEKEKMASSSKLKTLDLDFAVLPAAQQGTLLFEILQLIQQAHKSGKYADLMRYISCLEVLSLPGHFSKHFLEPLISENHDGIKEACVSLLAAQIVGRRKAVFDSKDYTNMALQISIMPLVSFNGLLGDGKASLSFIKCLEGVVKSLPSELIESGTGNLWEICLSLSGENKDLVIEFLKSLREILKRQARGTKQNKMSPKTQKYLEHFVSKRVFSDLREFSWADSDVDKLVAGEGSIMETYVNCLGALPSESLEQYAFFTYHEDDGFSGEVFRSLVILELVRLGYVKESEAQAVREISKVVAWFSRKLVAPGAEEYSESFRRLACGIAAATKVLSLPDRQSLLLSIFEQLLLCQPSAYSIGLDLLSVVVGSWCGDVTTDGDLSMIYLSVNSTEKLTGLSDAALVYVFGFLRHDLPFNLASYGRLEKISAIVSNQIWRLLGAWSKHNSEGEVLRCLKKAFICGSSNETKEEDFASLTSNMLLASDFFESTLLR